MIARFMMFPPKPPRPLCAYLLLFGLPGEEELHQLKYERVEDSIQGRFNLPIAQLENLPPHLSQEIFYIKINPLEERSEEDWHEGQIAFLGLSQIKYVGAVHIIHIATFLISPTALNLGFQASESLTLLDGTSVIAQAWLKNPHGNGYTGTNLFPLPEIDLTVDNQCINVTVQAADDSETDLSEHGIHPSFHNQIAFQKDDLIVTVSSDLALEDLKDIISRNVVIE